MRTQWVHNGCSLKNLKRMTKTRLKTYILYSRLYVDFITVLASSCCPKGLKDEARSSPFLKPRTIFLTLIIHTQGYSLQCWSWNANPEKCKSAEKHMHKVKYLILCFIPTMLDHVSLGQGWKYHFHGGKKKSKAFLPCFVSASKSSTVKLQRTSPANYSVAQCIVGKENHQERKV